MCMIVLRPRNCSIKCCFFLIISLILIISFQHLTLCQTKLNLMNKKRTKNSLLEDYDPEETATQKQKQKSRYSLLRILVLAPVPSVLFRIRWLYPLQRGNASSKRSVQGMTLNCIWCWGSSFGDLKRLECPFIAFHTLIYSFLPWSL